MSPPSLRSLKLRSALWVVCPLMAGVSLGLGGYLGWPSWVLGVLTVCVSLFGARQLVEIAWRGGRIDGFEEVNRLDERRRRWSQN